MQLIYRGIYYTPASVSTNTIDSGLTATYRGVRYSVQHTQATATLPATTLKYRGVTVGAPQADCHPAFHLASAQPALSMH